MSRLTVWRIVEERYREDAYSGEGARIYGGRFNSEGVPVIYTAGALSLAILEVLVRMNRRKRLETYWAVPAHFEEGHVEYRSVDELPENWREYPEPEETKRIGDTWAGEMRSLVLSVPSVVVPRERNYIINPRHELFEREVHIGEPERVEFDERLLQPE